MKKEKIVVGMSGGVDSSVTAYMLLEKGYDVEGIYLKLHETVDGYHEKNIQTISDVCEYLNIKFHILDLTKKFKEEVYDYFVNSYIDGNTPNPCVKCNKTIKFGAMIDKMKELNGSYLATGHYAKTDNEFIYCATDMTKDQSYFLAQVDKQSLKHMMFPMASFTKDYVKEVASKLPVLKEIAKKKESQEICFVPNVYTEILEKHTNIEMPGIALDTNGKEVGTHKGYMHYTVGKRRGFYVHGAHEPHFVIKSNKEDNTITVGKKEDLLVKEVTLDSLNMYVNEKNFTASVKLRYKSKSINCDVCIENNQAKLVLKDDIFGVAAGQLAVLYENDKVLGSGFITQTF
jgi:tRNA-specific 2-thiouridylase